MSRPRSLTTYTTFRVTGGDSPEHVIDAELTYDSVSPYAVGIAFRGAHGVVGCTFARDLLADGLLAPAGIGDVHVRPGRDVELVLELRSPSGVVALYADIADIAEFVVATYDLVPAGHEVLDIDFDAELAKL